MRAAAALPALFSSMKLIVEFTSSKTRIPRKSSQSGGWPCPLASTIAISAAASITHDNGFHMKPRNLRNLFSCTKALRRVTKVSAQKPDPECVSEKIPKESKQEGKKIANLQKKNKRLKMSL
jgi:hypothetical protein